MKLHDTAIAQIAKIVQMAILTGTDIVDHLRMVELEVNKDGLLKLEKEYKEIFDNSIEKMLTNVNSQSKEEEDEH
jgi:hypothetical protein